jgi:ABC-2 type transport system ATP-binding protein
MDAIALNGVERRMGNFTLGPLSFTVPRGAVLAFIGPNGAGKTTTLDLLMGMGAPDHGAIRVLDLEMPRDEVAIKHKTAYVSPDLSFLPWGRVGRALDFVAGFYPDWSDSRCEFLLQEFGIGRDERIAALSFGARIKLSLVMALARDAELLLLDEPTTGLDVAARLVLFREVMEFVRREDRTVIISSHQLSDLERLADHVAILNKGKLLTIGRMDALVERYIQIDARMLGSPSHLAGVTLLSRDGERMRLLLDREASSPARLAQAGVEILGETPMTLEEIFMALVADKP